MDNRLREEDRLKMPSTVFSPSCCLKFRFTADEIEQRYRSQEIERMIERDRRHFQKEVKILLLGAGESGKSTFLKQMKIIHGIKFEHDILLEYQITIYQNIMKGMKVLVDARNKLNISWENKENEEYGNFVLKFENNTRLDSRLFLAYAPSLYRLWNDSSIKKAYERRREFQLSDSVYYFLENLERISRIDYIPTNKDILHSRRATKGISEFIIQINNIPFRFVDVGGQRSQRQKWLQCFESVTSILFLVSSSEFDQVLVEDRKTNRLEESRNIFDTIINNVTFQCVSIILFLNKTDLLIEKLQNKQTNVRQFFPEFNGNPFNLNDVQTFLLQFFENVKRDSHKPLFHHFTTAVDTENIKVVFNAVKDTILRRNLRSLMLQ